MNFIVIILKVDMGYPEMSYKRRYEYQTRYGFLIVWSPKKYMIVG